MVIGIRGLCRQPFVGYTRLYTWQSSTRWSTYQWLPLDSLALGSLALGSLALGGLPLGSVQVSDIPVDRLPSIILLSVVLPLVVCLSVVFQFPSLVLFSAVLSGRFPPGALSIVTSSLGGLPLGIVFLLVVLYSAIFGVGPPSVILLGGPHSKASSLA
ncbi:hypothetical protein F4780DRAFT_173507 [Xylariomycetidae sp. FL0641]|nr:hypothetical protein F4780DRAFT_173507 [Xylariomycetidae sp. FL0641]